MYEEQLVVREGFVMEAKVLGRETFVLSLRKGETVLVEYRSDGGYEFRSVEKLRYDFERDVEEALRQG